MLANFYRGIVEKILDQARGSRALFSDRLIRDIGLQLASAPGRNLLHFQPLPISTAPRDGSLIVGLERTRNHPVLVRWKQAGLRGVSRWVEDHPTGEPVHPYAWVPIDAAMFHAERGADVE